MLYTHGISTTRLALGTKPLPQHLSRALLAAGPALTVTHRRGAGLQQQNFSTTRQHRLKEFFPQADAPSIHVTKPAWPHPIYTEDQMKQIEVAHREARTFGDRMALGLVRLLRWGLDIATGYKHDHGKPHMKNGKAVFAMDERKYLIRNVFLESVAGVPGMVGGMLRHLHSLRKLKRDNGWIETLLEESYNERMHLLIFMKLAEPGWFMRLMVLGTQGVFFNSMFIAYLLNPRICHRFVGYLEEEAVLTYSRQIEEIENGKLPHWADPSFKAPDIAVNYYNMPEGKRTMKDLLLHIRADEAKHREVNTTLGNLDQNNDPNPFVSEYKDKSKPHPTKSLENLRSTGWEREEVIGRAN